MGKALCSALNEPFKFTIASKEMYGVFKSSYEALVLRGQTKKRNALFLYLDCRIDTVAIPLYSAINFTITQSPGNVRNLAIIIDEHSENFSKKYCDIIRDRFPNLKRLYFLHTEMKDLKTYKSICQHEWKLVRIPWEYGDLIEFPEVLEDWEAWERKMMKASEIGTLRFMCAEAQQWNAKFLDYMESRKEWSGVAVDFCLEARRPKGARVWALECYSCIEYGGLYDDYRDTEWHWHKEPVIIKGDMLTECEPESAWKRCETCDRNRWQATKDAFWLAGR